MISSTHICNNEISSITTVILHQGQEYPTSKVPRHSKARVNPWIEPQEDHLNI